MLMCCADMMSDLKGVDFPWTSVISTESQGHWKGGMLTAKARRKQGSRVCGDTQNLFLRAAVRPRPTRYRIQIQKVECTRRLLRSSLVVQIVAQKQPETPSNHIRVEDYRSGDRSDTQSVPPVCKRDRRRDEMVIKHLDRVVQRRVSR